MIDPFVEPGADGPTADVGLLGVIGALFGALKNQARMSANAQSLAANEYVYSRFLIAPSRSSGGSGSVRGKGALATSGLGAFIGFFSRDFRHHDFVLGRRNCQWFLQEHFLLPRANTRVLGVTEGEQKFVPLIPCVGACAAEVELPNWPTEDNVDRRRLAWQIRKRAALFVLRAIGSLFDALFPPRPLSLWSRAWRVALTPVAVIVLLYLSPLIVVGSLLLMTLVRRKIHKALDETVRRNSA